MERVNEEMGFKKDESVLMTANMMGGWGMGQQHALACPLTQRTGHVPGQISGVRASWAAQPIRYPQRIWATMREDSPWSCSQIARDLYDYGFKTNSHLRVDREEKL